MAYDHDPDDDDAALAEAERIAATIAERRFRLRAFCDRVSDRQANQNLSLLKAKT